MNLESLRAKLLAAARANPPSDRVPYAFEQRILARLDRPPVPDLGLLWTRMLWRATGPCIVVALLAAAWAFQGGGGMTGENQELVEFAPEFEETMLAEVNAQVEELW